MSFKRYYSKDNLKALCGMTTSCIRDYNSLYRQYRECRYNEIDIIKPSDIKRNLFYRYHNDFISTISQKVIMIDNGVYLYVYKELLVVVIGTHISTGENEICNKINKYILSYKKITSNICPSVLWCCLHVYIDSFCRISNACIYNVNANVYHDVFILGNIQHKLKEVDNVRRYTYMAIEEENAKKNKYIILKGYGCKLDDMTLFDYCLEIMNRIANIEE